MNKNLESRVAELEQRLAAFERKTATGDRAWVKCAGWAENDPIYEEAMKLGTRWRARENRKPQPHAGRR